MFQSFIYTDYAEQKEINNLIQNYEINEPIIISDSMPLLFSYYLYTNKVFKSFEPSMKDIETAFKVFSNNPEVYYDSKKYDFNNFKSLAYSLTGRNYLEFIKYYCYYITFLINGRPYMFYDEIGSASSAIGLLSSINNYFESHLKMLVKETQIVISSFNAVEMYDVFKKNDQLDALQGCLNKMLDFDAIIKLRNDEMNKSPELLDDSYRNQNVLTEKFLYDSYLQNMDELIKIVVEANPFKKVFEHLPVFEPIDLIHPRAGDGMRALNIDELINLTGYVISGGDKDFMISRRENYAYKPYQQQLNKHIFPMFGEQSIKSQINKFKRCIGYPFTESDIVLKSLQSYIKQQFIDQQDSAIFGDAGMVNDPIKIDWHDFTEDVAKEIKTCFINGLWMSNFTEMNVIIRGLLDTNPRFKEQYNDLDKIGIIANQVYRQIPASICLSIYLMSYLNDAVYEYITKTIGIDFKNFDYMHWVMKYIISSYNEDNKKRMDKIYDMLISDAFISTNEYARFINITMQDFEKYLMNGKIVNAYVSGNSDQCELYSIGGVYLYNCMLDSNPFNRGYKFVSTMMGTTQNIERFHNLISFFNDASFIKLIEQTDNQETILNILKSYANDYATKQPELLSSYLFTITDEGEQQKLTYEHKSLTDWINLKLSNGNYVYELLLMYAFDQIKGSYHDEEFRTKELIVKEDGKVDAFSKSEEVNKLLGTAAIIQEIGADSYKLPVLKYVGEYSDVKVSFVNPIGYKLLKLDILDCQNQPSMCIMLFTKAKLKTMYNVYN